MRIGLVIYGGLENLSGGFLYDRFLVEGLRSRGDQVAVIALPWRDYLRHLGDNLSPTLLSRLGSEPFDLLLQDELVHPSLFWLNRRLREIASCPIVTIIHHLRSSEPRSRWLNRLYRMVERRYLETLDGMIYNSRVTREVVGGLIGPGRPGLVAHPGRDHLHPRIDALGIAARARRPGPLRILFVANLIPRKGLHTLLEALASLDTKSLRLTVIGSTAVDRRYAARIRRLIQRQNLEAIVHMTGGLPNESVAEHLAKAHLLAVPSAYEGFGIVYLEAMGFGVPPIASASGGARDLVRHGENGYLVPPGEPEVLAEHIQRLAADRDLLSRLSLTAREDYAAHPTWGESVEEIRNFLEERMYR